ncbi:MAG TPA: sialidase family protein [Gemmatimonadaceae bacterium]|nr:sialidase family protein [Gemmatimonadaceae bacterium]
MCRPTRHRVPLARPLLVAAIVLGACAAPPVDWRPATAVARIRGEGVALTADGAVRPDSIGRLAPHVAAPPGPVCASSLRLASARGTVFGVWWAPRPDSGARLLAARSTDGGRSWSAPAAVDTTDAGVAGCRREPASIAADSASGYVHVAYALQGVEGPGLFFSESMDGGVTFHAPVPILYGERLGATSVAADGDLVVVAFEDPNSSTPRIGLALSRTMGHIFEQRILPVSDDNDRAVHPLVAVAGRRVAVAWEPSGGDSDMLTVRAGIVR